ncbi:MAG: oligoendopeptidase F [Chloroflexota bacterium]
MAKQLLTRSEVPVELTWNLTDIFPDKEAWEAELAAVVADVKTVTQYRGRFAEGAKVLLDCATAYEALLIRAMRVANYAQLNLSVDGRSGEFQMMAGRMAAALAGLEAEVSFIRSEALALPEGTLERYMDEEPGLKEFSRMIEQMLAEKPHVLSPETEMALASLGEVLEAPYMMYERTKTSDITFPNFVDADGAEVPMSFAGYENRYERSADVTTRRNAFAAFTEGLKKYQNTSAATFATEVKKNVVLAKLRKYESATHMLLARQEVPIEVYHNLHDIILPELAPHMRRYARLRKRVLGLDKLLYCDIEAPLDPGYNPQITFDEAKDIIIKGVSVMGKEYTDIVADALNNRWIDLAENLGKATGAFCSAVWGVHPYILITFDGGMRTALVLAHELGHATNGVLTERNQRAANANPSMFFVEGPSTINELLVGNHIMSQSNDTRIRRWVIMQFLATYHHNFVRHLIEGELQRRIYRLAEQGQTITAATLSTVQGEILSEFWGGEVEIDDGAKLTWMRQPHYYMGLYPYSYSAGLTISTAAAQNIFTEGQPAVDRWLSVCKAGGTKKPLDLAKQAGVDLSQPEPIRKAVAYVGKLVEDLEKCF